MRPGRGLALLALVSSPVLAQDTPPGVEDLLKALDDDSVEVRERASAGLERLGEEARPALLRRGAEPASLEMRARIEELLGRMDGARRRREFKGGEPVGGFVSRLEVRQEPGDGTILFRVEFMNLGPRPAEFVTVLFWDTSLPGLSSHSSYSQAGLKVTLLEGEVSPGGRGRHRCGSPSPRRTTVTMEAGEIRAFEFRLNGEKDEYHALKPGSYEARVVYYARSKALLVGAREELESNPVRFTVKE